MSVRVEKDGPLTTVVLDRPGRKNAVDRETAQSLADAFRAFAADDAALVAVLWGDHGAFCSGADLKAMAEGRPNRVEATGDGPMGPTRMHLTKPVIAAISGPAVGGGLELALWCDLRVAEEDSVLGFANRRFGVPLIDGGTVRLPRLIGLGPALDLILTGRLVGAREARAMGLVSRVVAKGAARPEAEELARQLAAFPQAALRADRLSAIEGAGLGFEAAMANEIERGRAALGAEAQDGARWFASGRGRHGAKVGPDRKA
jgi:enoyl-CoA hydratase